MMTVKEMDDVEFIRDRDGNDWSLHFETPQKIISYYEYFNKLESDYRTKIREEFLALFYET